jgi:hypothetical protein
MASAMSSWFISTGPTRIDLAVVRFRILQQGGDDAGLILTGDGGVPPAAHGQSDDAAGAVGGPGPVEPLGEERGPQVLGQHGRAVQRLLGDPVMFACPSRSAASSRSPDPAKPGPVS